MSGALEQFPGTGSALTSVIFLAAIISVPDFLLRPSGCPGHGFAPDKLIMHSGLGAPVASRIPVPKVACLQPQEQENGECPGARALMMAGSGGNKAACILEGGGSLGKAGVMQKSPRAI